MDALQESVLYAFHPDRVITMEQVAYFSKRMLPYVRNTINREFVRDGLVEEVFVGAPGNYFKLTVKGMEEVRRIHNKRQALRNRIAELKAQGHRASEAAKIAAVEAVVSDISGS